MRWWLGWLALVSAALVTGCSSDPSCAPTARGTGPCADLRFRGADYDEWRTIDAPPPARMQEVGNATYPACNATGCHGDVLAGNGATDVWQLADVDLHDAVIGIRQGTHTFVVFVRVGVDRATLPADPHAG